MSKHGFVLPLTFLAMLAVAVSACVSASGSASYYEDRFSGDPLTYLVGKWEGTVQVAGDQLPPARMLIVYPGQTGSTIWAQYGIPETRHQGPTSILIEGYDGKVSVNFRTGSNSKVNLWLQRMGNDLVLNGTLKSQNGIPWQIILKKVK